MICRDRQERKNRTRERIRWGRWEWVNPGEGLFMFYKCQEQQSQRPNESDVVLLALSRSPVASWCSHFPLRDPRSTAVGEIRSDTECLREARRRWIS